MTPIIAIFYITYQLSIIKQNNHFNLEQLVSSETSIMANLFLILVLFTAINWCLEGFKWQISTKSMTPMSFSKALKQSLAGASAGIFTPAKTGDYVAKITFFSKDQRSKILMLNAFNNLIQLGVTCLFGMLGMYLLYRIFPSLRDVFSFEKVILSGLVASILIISLLLIFRKWLSGHFSKLVAIISTGSVSLGFKVFGLSVLRYLVFSIQFIFLLQLLGTELSFYLCFICISSIYFINSVIPTSALSDVIIKGSLGVFLFGMFGVNPWIILTASVLMWTANHVMPALIGSYLLVRSKSLRSY